MDLLKLDIVTPKAQIFSGDVKSVTLPGSEGEFGVLPGHAATISLLKTGVVDIEKSSSKHDLVAITKGYCEVDERGVTILADDAVYVGGDESESEIASSIKKVERLLEEIKSDPIVVENVISEIKNIRS